MTKIKTGDYTYTPTPPIRASEVYGTDCVTVPTGYKVVGFRPPKNYEYLLTKDGSVFKALVDFDSTQPGFVVEKVWEPGRRFTVVTAADVYSNEVLQAIAAKYQPDQLEFRKPLAEETLLSLDGSAVKASFDYSEPRFVVVKKD